MSRVKEEEKDGSIIVSTNYNKSNHKDYRNQSESSESTVTVKLSENQRRTGISPSQ